MFERVGMATTLLACLPACMGDVIMDFGEVPEEVRFVALLPQGSEAEGSAIVDLDLPRTSTFVNAWTEGELYVLGWRGDQIGPELLAKPAPIRRARADESARLEPHIWQGTASLEGRILSQRVEPITVTSQFAPECSLPELGPVELNCTPCAVALARSRDCGVDIDLESCGLGTISGRFGAEGRFEITDVTSSMTACSVSETPEGAALELDCRFGPVASCRVIVHEPSTPSLIVESTELLGDRVPVVSRGPKSWETHGYLQDLEVMGGEIMVAETVTAAGITCRGAESRLHRLSLDLTPSSVSSAPVCLTRLATDSGLLFAAYGGQGSPRVGQLRPDGSIVAERDLTPLLSLTSQGYVADLVVRENRLAVTVNDAAEQIRAWVIELDARTLEMTRIWEHGLGERAHRIRASRDDGWMALGDEPDGVYEMGDGEMTIRGVGASCAMTAADPFDFLGVEGSIFVGSWQSGSIVRLEGMSCLDQSRFFEGRAGVYGITLLDDNGSLAAGVTMEDGTARVAEFDTTQMRFRPGSTVVGKGTWSRARYQDGWAYGILPEEARIVRVRSRDLSL